jgi:GNAT superfamily N-acetyltransferase
MAAIHSRSTRMAYRGILPDAVIEEVTGDEASRAERLRERLEDVASPQRRFVAERGGVVVGLASWSASQDADVPAGTAEVDALYVDPAVIGQGVGRTLFGALVADVRSSGATTAVLWVLEDNGRARRFYEAAGWSADGATEIEHRRGGDLRLVRYRSDW